MRTNHQHKFTFLKKASFSFSSLAEEDPGEIIRDLPSSSSSEASVFYSHVDKSAWLLQFFLKKRCSPMFSTMHFINRVLSGLRFTSSESTGLKRMLESCLLHMQTAMLFFWEYILSLNKYLWSELSKISLQVSTSLKIRTFEIQQARALLLKLAVHFFTHIA